MNNCYWFVYRQGGNAPAHKHETQEEALNEARRLAQCAPQVCHYVCKVLLEVTYDENPYRIKQLGKKRDH